MNQEAVNNGEVLRVSNRTCESVTLVGNTLECTVPMELQKAAKELEVEVQDSFILFSTSDHSSLDGPHKSHSLASQLCPACSRSPSKYQT